MLESQFSFFLLVGRIAHRLYTETAFWVKYVVDRKGQMYQIAV